MSHTGDALNKIQESVKTRFEKSKRVLSFEEYLELVSTAPSLHLRTAAQYAYDAILSYGTREIQVRGRNVQRYRIFDGPASEQTRPILGQEGVQQALVQILTGFSRAGRADKLVTLHGPNGSAKSSLVKTLFDGIEGYSEKDEGALFGFSWVFPTNPPEKGGLGFGAAKREGFDPIESFAKLDPDKIGAVIRSELHENPIALIPLAERKVLFERWVKDARTPEAREGLEAKRESFFKAELSHKNSILFEALLNEAKGDYRRVLRHVRVERFFMSRRLRTGLVTVEPQFSVDAGARQVTGDRSLAHLPAALQSLNLFQLEGDLVDGNRGIVEYNDLLKRPPEHFKYLLGTCETGTVTLGHILAFLDTLFIATTNDRQLEAFREHPDFNSFKARMEFVRVPYLLRFSDEERIYSETARAAAGEKEVMPHTTRLLAIWAVLTRLKRPMTKNKGPVLAKILENLTPLAKAKLYDSGELPGELADEERRELRGHIEELIQEQQAQPYYEGLMGASARELKVALQLAAQNEQFNTLGPNAVIEELRKLVQRPMDYEYLRIEPNHGYHDYEGFIGTAKDEWLDVVDTEMLASLNLQRNVQLKDFLARYVTHATNFVRGEKVKNRVTGQAEAADETILREFEEYADVPMAAAEEFRKNLISRLGAWRIEQPQADITKGLPYDVIFPDLIRKAQMKFRNDDAAKIRLMGGSILDSNAFDSALNASDPAALSESAAMAVRAYTGLQERFGYGPNGAKEALATLIRERYL